MKPEIDPPDGPFVAVTPDQINLGEITTEVSQAIRRQRGFIRLSQGSHDPLTGRGWGENHIEARHGAQIRAAGFPSVADFVSRIATRYNQVWGARKGRLFLVEADENRAFVAVIELRPSLDGDYYEIVSASPYRREFFRVEKRGRKELTLLWERPGPDAQNPSLRPWRPEH